jgi:hypothetical protein
MAGHYHIKPDPTLTAGWGIIPRNGPGSGPNRRRAHYYRNGYPVCGIRLPNMPYTGPLRAQRNLDSNCDRCERALNPTPRRENHSLYEASTQCRHCGRDYLYPAYGTRRGTCNDCATKRIYGPDAAARPHNHVDVSDDRRITSGQRHGV